MGENTPRRIALSISGAISLGAYEAGVLTQLYWCIDDHNRKNENDPICIDVISGASAGSATGLILGRAIAFGIEPRDFQKIMEQVWIDDVDIRSLLGDTDSDDLAIFPSASLQRAGERILKLTEEERTRYRRVAFSAALTNLEGFPLKVSDELYAMEHRDYSMQILDGNQVWDIVAPTEVLRDQKEELEKMDEHSTLRALTMGRPARKWEEIIPFALASGAFPFAFRTYQLRRELASYPKVQEAIEHAGLNPAEFPKLDRTYTDGGVLHNQPLGRAIDLAGWLDAVDGQSTRRLFLLVAPVYLSDETIRTKVKQKPNAESGLKFTSLLGNLIPAIQSRGIYEDYLTAKKTNDRIDAVDRELDALGIDDPEKRAAMHQAAHGHKQKIELQTLIGRAGRPPGRVLKGAYLGNFGGFLDKRTRQHDFAIGCMEAREWFERNYGPTIPAVSTPPSSAPGSFDELPEATRRDLRDRVAHRSEKLVQLHGLPWIVQWLTAPAIKSLWKV